MKPTKFFLLALLFLSFLSCSKDDEDRKDVNTELLTGSWNLTEFTYDGYSDTRLSGENFHIEYTGTAENIDATFSFNSNGSFIAEGEYDIILKSSSFTQPYRDIAVTSSGNWSLTDNTVEITNFRSVTNVNTEEPPAETVMTILELTENRLVLELTEEITITEDEDEGFISNTGQYVLTK